MRTFKQGVDAGTGRIITVEEAERRKKTAYVRTVKVPDKPKPRGKGK